MTPRHPTHPQSGLDTPKGRWPRWPGGRQARAFPLDASDRAAHTACPAVPSLRQIYLVLILKMQLSLTFIAEIKQTGVGGGKPAEPAHPRADCDRTRCAWTALTSPRREGGRPPTWPCDGRPKDGALLTGAGAREVFPSAPARAALAPRGACPPPTSTEVIATSLPEQHRQAPEHRALGSAREEAKCFRG